MLFAYKEPDGYFWDFPGFYSLTVPYGRANDFLYSGNVGCCMICFCEFKSHGWTKLSYFSLVTMIFAYLLMICLRGIYAVDLIIGIIFSHYAWIISERYCYLIDVKVFRIPFKKRFPIVKDQCVMCQHRIFEIRGKGEEMPLKHDNGKRGCE